MRVYISSPGWKVLQELLRRRPDIRLNILLTKARMPRRYKEFLKEFVKIIETVVLDNGAYSAINSNLGITVRQLLARFACHAEEHGARYLMVFSPDFEFGPKGFDANYERWMDMEDLGIVSVPVIHNLKNHEAWSYASDLPEFIAIGQSKGRLEPGNLFPLVYRLHHEKHIKVHLFGVTKFSLLAGCPVSSCDSKSWIDDANTGVVRFWNPENPGADKCDMIYFPDNMGKTRPGMFTRYNYPFIDAFEQHIKDQLGLTMDNLIGMKRGGFYRQLVQIMYYKQLEEIVTNLHIKKGIVL